MEKHDLHYGFHYNSDSDLMKNFRVIVLNQKKEENKINFKIND